jgi:hypothetical protein
MLGAEPGFVLPVLGRNMYEELQEFCDEPPPEPLSEVQLSMKDLLDRVRFAIVHLGYFMGFDFLNVSVSDMGFQRIESERSKSLYKYQEDNLRNTTARPVLTPWTRSCFLWRSGRAFLGVADEPPVDRLPPDADPHRPGVR